MELYRETADVAVVVAVAKRIARHVESFVALDAR